MHEKQQESGGEPDLEELYPTWPVVRMILTVVTMIGIMVGAWLLYG